MVIPVVFMVVLILLLAALVAVISSRWMNEQATRKEAAQSAGLLLVVLLILGAFLPDDTAPPETPGTTNTEPAVHPVFSPHCEDLLDRIQRLECVYHGAVRAHRDSDTKLALAHYEYLTTACPPCEEIYRACIKEWRVRNDDTTGPWGDDLARCMDRAWPPSVWPRYQNLPLPKMPPDLAAHMRAAMQRAR